MADNPADDELTLRAHQRREAREKYERNARLRIRDIQYKVALGLSPIQPLPKALGSAGGTRGASYTNLKGSKRLG